MKQRVAIARTFAFGPKELLADDLHVISSAQGRLLRHSPMRQPRPRTLNRAGSELLDRREDILGLLPPTGAMVLENPSNRREI
tara:strand:+ start:1546 stop:1794 length:249 start_codon:yes stop_codon:yes gene_type:complete